MFMNTVSDVEIKMASAIERLSDLPDELYKLTEVAANEFYAYGTTELLAEAARRTGLSQEDILLCW